MAPAGKPIHFDCAGIRVPKYILMPFNGGKLIVKDPFGNSVSSDRCLVQKRFAKRSDARD